MDSLIVGLAIEAQARELDAEAAALREETADAGVNIPAPGVEALVRELVARELHAIAARLWGPDSRDRRAGHR
jgi:hypothetical protein